jgi:acyl carrier protein
MVVTTSAASASASTAFPLAAIESCLHAELIEAIKLEASIKGVSIPATPAQIAKTSFQIDSLVVVDILCAVEPIVGFELPDSVVRAGGYRSVENVLGQLLPRIEKLWMKRKGAQP